VLLGSPTTSHRLTVKQCGPVRWVQPFVHLQRTSSAHSGPIDDVLSLLCIEFEGHQPFKGLFFPVVNLSSTSIAAALADDARTRYSFPDGTLSVAEAAAASASQSPYTVGSVLLTFSNGTLTSQSVGILSQPSGAIGSCSDVSPARFLVDEVGQVCTRSAVEATAGCVTGGALDIRTYASTGVGTYLLQRVGGSASSRTTIDNVTVLVITADQTVALSRGLSDPPIDVASFAALLTGGDTCSNAVTAVSRTIVWDGQAVVQLVTSITLENVSTTSAVAQLFATRFRTTAVTTDSAGTVASSLISEVRSGNPGYIVGTPILATLLSGYVGGTAANNVTFGTPTNPNTTAVLTILAPTASGSDCPGSTTPIQFGIDQVSGCVLAVAADDTCSQIRAAATAAVDKGLNRVGCIREYGTGVDSECVPVLDEDSGVSIGVNDTAHDDGMVFLLPNYYCQGVLTEANLEVLVARQGSQDFPQKRIVAAKLTRVYSDVVIGCGGHVSDPYNISGCANPTVGESTLTLYHSIKFTTVPRKAFRYTGDLPPPVYGNGPQLGCRHTTCYDQIFYPFVTKWNATSPLDLEFQRAKAYSILLAGCAALGVVVWISIWGSMESNCRGG
jgi:hypothetical protein